MLSQYKQLEISMTKLGIDKYGFKNIKRSIKQNFKLQSIKIGGRTLEQLKMDADTLKGMEDSLC